VEDTALRLEFDTVLLVGDTHANPTWWHQVVKAEAARLDVDAIVVLGDFGWWPHDTAFRKSVQEFQIPTWFLDGNHEHHHDLAAAVATARNRMGIDDPTSPVQLDGNLGYLPRGARFSVGDVSVACVGGTHSIDRTHRTAGVDWFAEERLDDVDIQRASQYGHVDVLLCHDAPAGWEIPGLRPDAQLPPTWQTERPICREHRQRLREIFVALTPRHVVHGHYHSAYSLDVVEAWGTVHVDGLDCDDEPHSLATLSHDAGTPVISRVDLH
jgi:predicted phosphodiesterase